MKQNYQWQGEPVKVQFGYASITPNSEKPLFWYNYECLKQGLSKIPAVQITSKGGYSFVIANHFGVGVYKLNSGGWPNRPHFSLVDDSFTEDETGKIEVFDDINYISHEMARNKWMAENHAAEYAKMEALRKMIKR